MSEQAKSELKKHYSSITAKNGMKPMLFDDNYELKAAYDTVMKVVEEV